MNRVQQRKKQRREYLLKKGTARASVSVLRLTPVAFVVAMVLLAALHVFEPAFLAPLCFAACYFLMRYGGHIVSDFEQEAKSIPYVLPVTLDTVSAEEVLVRGADEPRAPIETLLRPTQHDVQSKSEVLLRSDYDFRSKVSDRLKQRREYLRRKRKAYAVAGAAGVTLVPSIVASAILFASAFCVLYLCLTNPGHPDTGELGGMAGLLMVMGTVFGLISGLSWSKVKQAQQSLATLPYVGPVIPSTLPDEEVLVRGAEVPSTASETLLRATVKAEETKPEQLLRSSTSG